MALLKTDTAYRQLRAPVQDRMAWIDPHLREVPSVVQQNRDRLARGQCDVQGRSMERLAATAREGLVQAAVRYTACYRDVDDAVGQRGRSILLAGHQPQLFHAGVWFKTFVLDALAREHDALAVQLLIDNDACRRTSIDVLGGSPVEPMSQAVAFDRMGDVVPYEQRKIHDLETFQSFGRRVAGVIAPHVPEPLLAELWPRAIAASRRTDNLGQCIAQARHQMESTWGLATLEVPLSVVCQTEEFRWFTVHLLTHLPRLHAIYNSALGQYRQAARIRSRSHPVGDLARRDQWLEAPLWVWDAGQPQRRPLWVRRRGQQLLLSDGVTPPWPLDARPDGDGGWAVDQLGQLAQRGIVLRPRALITTMYARLLLGDLFVHGIGGAKYDQLTDMLIQRFFEREPPGFLTVSATLLLPVARPQVGREDLRRAEQQLRELRFHPERHLDGVRPGLDPQVSELVAEKRRWIQTHPPRGAGRARHEAIERVNQALAPRVRIARERLLQERDDIRTLLKHHSILASREYAFCLFPESYLQSALRGLLAEGT
jgi:hypothetical protein